MTREMKNSGVEWIGNIPSEWKIIKSKYIFANHKEIVGDRENNFERLSLTLNGVLKRPKDDSKGLQSESLSTYQVLYKDELVFKMIDLENTSTSRVGYSPYTGLVSPVYIVFNNNKYSKYGFWYFYNLWQRNIYNTLGNNGVRSALNASDMLNLPFIQIPNEEQTRISDFLDSKVTEIDKIISETRASIENYKEYKQSVITEAVIKGLDKNVPMKESGIEWIGKIPCEWKATKLKNVSENVTDGAHISPETDNGVYDFISTVNLDNGQIDFDNCLKTSVNSYKYLVNTGCKPQINDVLISKDGTVGKTIVIDFQHDFVVASSLVIIRPTTEIICPYYLNYNLQSKFVQDTLLMLMHGAGLKRVSVEKNENLPVVVPPMEEQTKIVEYLNYRCTEIDTLILQKEKLITNLEEYKKSLIYEYVTGKKAVE